MKKFLLFAAAAVALSASAQLTIEKQWESTANTALVTNDVRQGVGANGKFYIHDKTNQKVVVYGQNGLTDQEFAGGTNCGISMDEAGNLIVSLASFPNSWSCNGETADLRVINPTTGESKELKISPDAAIAGRADMLGFAKGNLMEDGEINLVGGTSTGVSRVIVSEGEVSEDDSYVALCEGLSMTTSTVINMVGDQILFVTRNAVPCLLTLDGDNYTKEALTLPNKGACNGAFPFTLGGKNYICYPTLPNYEDGFAIAEVGAEEAEVTVAAAHGQKNGVQCNWLNVEVVSDTEANVYQYQPGGHMSVFKVTVPTTGISDLSVKAAKAYKTIENGQVVIVKGDARYNTMGQAVK